MLRFTVLVAIFAFAYSAVDYSGYKVLKVVPRNHEHVELLHKLRTDYGVDLWNEPRAVGMPVLFHLEPKLTTTVQHILREKQMEHGIIYHDLQSTILSERVAHGTRNVSQAAAFDFGKYNQYSDIVDLLNTLASNYGSIAELQTIGQSYENRDIYNMKVSSGSSTEKPAIVIECGIHAREWSSVAACVYLLNKLVTGYESDQTAKSLVDQYEINIIVEANPDGYIYTWTQDRLWRKTRSRSSLDWLGNCRGADANRNFDIEHCGVGTSRKPCDEIYCGDKPFSESEARALRDIMVRLGSRLKGYFSVHAFSQLWMTPYGTKKSLPPNYSDLKRVADAGVQALSKKYGTVYQVGSIANIIYEAAGSSVDYAYEKMNVAMGFALELRDTGRFGFFLPRQLILPMAEETYDGLVAAIQAL